MARDYTKYDFNGVIYSKRGVVKAVVEDYVKKHGLAQAELVFNQIRTDKAVVTPNGGDRYVHTQVGGESFDFYTQWGFGVDGFFEKFLALAKNLGYKLTPIP